MLRDDGTPVDTSWRGNFHGSVNVPHRQVYDQLRENIRRPLPQVDWRPPNDYKVALLCGGPSLERAKVPRGYKVATVNGAYGWALDHGYRPSVYVSLDARPFNLRFVEGRKLETCKYLLCSQAHPSVFDYLSDCDVRIWHAAAAPEKKILDRYYLSRWRNIPGGSTAGTRAITLLYMLGIRTIRVYGLDCSHAKGRHHAYAQPENDTDSYRTVRVGRRRFQASGWMVAQLDEFLQLAPNFPADLRLSFEGDGLLQYVVNETHKRGKAPTISVES